MDNQYLKIQPKAIDVALKLGGINPTNSIVYSPGPHTGRNQTVLG